MKGRRSDVGEDGDYCWQELLLVIPQKSEFRTRQANKPAESVIRAQRARRRG